MLKEGERDYDDPCIKLSALQRLPLNARVCSIIGARDMAGELLDCMIVVWNEPSQGVRKGLFSKETGEYVGDL